MIRFHCALPFEASPINAYFGLNVLQRHKSYTLFGNDNYQLLLSGSGKKRVKDSLKDFDFKKWGQMPWLNVGIAGSKQYAFGDAVAVSAVAYANNDCVKIGSGQALVLTVDEPCQNYPDKGVVDMELWHLLQEVSDIEDLYSIKIVSDTPEDIFLRNKKDIKVLIRKNIDFIEEIVKKITL